MTLWLARHARPLVAPGVCYGQLDVAADEAATRFSATQLAALLPAHSRVAASPLQRCAQLAQALQQQRPDLLVETDARLQEMNFGDWEGRAWADISADELRAWTDDFAHYQPGGHGENVTTFMARVADTFDAIDLAAPTTLWITHAGVIRAVDLLLRGVRRLDHAAQWPTAAPEYGQWQTRDLPASADDHSA